MTTTELSLDNFLRLGVADSPDHRIVIVMELYVGRIALAEELVNCSVDG